MELKTRTPHRVSRTRSGMVLLLALTVILLMSVALMKAFENKTIEVAHLRNNAQTFQAETLSRSVLKVILLILKENNLVRVIGNRSLWEGQIFPLEGVASGFFEITELRPMDHLFNLNRKISTANGPARSTEFNNLVNILKKEIDVDSLAISSGETEEALSAMIDFTDVDIDMDSVFMYDHESYPGEEPEFEVKNQLLDRVSEIKLIPAVKALGILDTERYKDYFRASGDSSQETIDVNLAQPGEIESFLARFEGIPEYAEVYDQRGRIDAIATETDETTPEENLIAGIKNLNPRFPVSGFNRQNSLWLESLRTAGINLNQNEIKLFKPTTEYLRIRYSLYVGEVRQLAEALIQLRYAQNKHVIQGITVISFDVRRG